MLVVVGSVKGSPGVSCLTAGVAGRLRQERLPVLVLDADPAGGVFTCRAGLAAHPGLVSLAAATRGAPLSVDVVAAHVQVLASGAGLLAGPPAGDQASSALEVLAERLAQFARSRPGPEVILADVGRLDAGSAATPLVRGADGAVLVMRADREGLEQAGAWLRTDPEQRGRTALVTRQPSGGTEYRAAEIADALGVPVLGRLPEDGTANAAFGGPPRRNGGRGGRGGRGGWWQAVGQVADQVRALTGPVRDGTLPPQRPMAPMGPR
ncbi:hypothetical protein [Pseudonocardia sp.]|uniref:hypothetical protein n=1 Tax=Pseudonocardia sp. TaxID=60912 RepID=UPI003D0AED29